MIPRTDLPLLFPLRCLTMRGVWRYAPAGCCCLLCHCRVRIGRNVLHCWERRCCTYGSGNRLPSIPTLLPSSHLVSLLLFFPCTSIHIPHMPHDMPVDGLGVVTVTPAILPLTIPPCVGVCLLDVGFACLPLPCLRCSLRLPVLRIPVLLYKVILYICTAVLPVVPCRYTFLHGYYHHDACLVCRATTYCCVAAAAAPL